ncbi:hypothetical protein F2Q68_00018127 [Brassica cretica]|uniref:Uncharacterized protein n=2 Tax=Brassica cretica TaxID=69181 RepID=A0A8S9HJ31_BRACR|nr:hypothetical protein F2Q68_00018127 [Brassica cretica]
MASLLCSFKLLHLGGGRSGVERWVSMGCSSASCYDLLSSPVFKEDVSLSAGACSVNKRSCGGGFAEKSSPHDPEQDREVIAIDLGFSSRPLRRLTISCLRRGYSLQAQFDQIWFPDLGQGAGLERLFLDGFHSTWQLDFFWLGSNGGLRITLVSLTSVIGFSRLRLGKSSFSGYSGDDTQRTGIRGNESALAEGVGMAGERS